LHGAISFDFFRLRLLHRKATADVLGGGGDIAVSGFCCPVDLKAEREHLAPLPGAQADGSSREGRSLEEDTFSFVPSPCATSAKTSKASKVFDDDANDAHLDPSKNNGVTKTCFREQRQTTMRMNQ